MYSLPTNNFLQYINGELVAGQGRTTQICCPGNGEPVAQVALASREQAQLALEAARDAFPAWSGLTLEERGAFQGQKGLQLVGNHQTVLVKAGFPLGCVLYGLFHYQGVGSVIRGDKIGQFRLGSLQQQFLLGTI